MQEIVHPVECSASAVSAAPKTLSAFSPVDLVRDVVGGLRQLTVTGDVDGLLVSIAAAERALIDVRQTYRNSPLLRALGETAKLFQELSLESSVADVVRRRDIFNPELRARWIQSEVEAVDPTSEITVSPAERRVLGQLLGGEVPLHWELRTIAKRELADAGATRSIERLTTGQKLELAPGCELTLRLYTHRKPPADTLLQSMANLNASLVIDRSVPGPQKGFGRAISAEEMRPWFESPDVELYTLELNNSFVGYFAFFNGTFRRAHHLWPVVPAVKEAVVESRPLTQAGWFEIVGIDRETRTMLKRDYRVSGYELLLSAVTDAAFNFNVDSIFCQVREGDDANLAKANHLAAGFRETPIQFSECGMQYRVLFMDMDERIDREVLRHAIEDRSWLQRRIER